ncbi:hypothetical protein [Nocardia stercoris]|uniref:DUF385 domain-containing protein n=1 Tax=Nocardia stercoris TaxID=2483361 RepID=A0A3M2L824_9NOCA|nr:hypothetical protein [Nocardia stercoris]RMI33524.1 hypothetical protein EBN03_10420 [Nocardia stercoris]
MALRAVLSPVARVVNAGVMTLAGLPVIGPRISKNLAEITYVGRRSGRTITTPIAFTRSGDTVTINVIMPDAKTWWRNFLGAGGPASLRLDGVDRPGHAVAHRDDSGRVTVEVRLDPA